MHEFSYRVGSWYSRHIKMRLNRQSSWLRCGSMVVKVWYTLVHAIIVSSIDDAIYARCFA